MNRSHYIEVIADVDHASGESDHVAADDVLVEQPTSKFSCPGKALSSRDLPCLSRVSPQMSFGNELNSSKNGLRSVTTVGTESSIECFSLPALSLVHN